MNRAYATLALCLFVGCGAPPETSDPRVDRVDAYFEGLELEGRFSGVVLVALGGVAQLERGYGWADAESLVANTPSTILRIGSLTKPITASAVSRSISSGKLDLDGAACASIEHCPSSWSGVTIEHLLTHTSGIPDLFGELEAVPVEATAAELDRLLRALEPDAALDSAPGEEYAYSNFNYVLLGVALEHAYGSTWGEILQQTVFGPLALEHTAYDDVWEVVPDRARGYSRERDGLRNIEYDDHAAYAAGGLHSTGADLLIWSTAVFSGSLLGDELTAASLTPFKGDYGYGWQTREFFGRKIHNHTGGIDGFSSHLAHYPDDDLTLIVLSNIEDDSAILSACDAAALWFEWRDPPETPTSWLELEPRQRCGLE